ncbi:MAG TPA: hypothetical protein PL187_24005, partial [Caldilinea sp.]|nr:hypothetical protein [Caldilinea sp.]
YLAWDWLEHYLFQEKYPGLGHIVLGWCVYTVVSEPVRCLTWSFQAMQRFRELAHLAVANAAIVMAFMAILVLPVQSNSVTCPACIASGSTAGESFIRSMARTPCS